MAMKILGLQEALLRVSKTFSKRNWLTSSYKGSSDENGLWTPVQLLPLQSI